MNTAEIYKWKINCSHKSIPDKSHKDLCNSATESKIFLPWFKEKKGGFICEFFERAGKFLVWLIGSYCIFCMAPSWWLNLEWFWVFLYIYIYHNLTVSIVPVQVSPGHLARTWKIFTASSSLLSSWIRQIRGKSICEAFPVWKASHEMWPCICFFIYFSF